MDKTRRSVVTLGSLAVLVAALLSSPTSSSAGTSSDRTRAAAATPAIALGNGFVSFPDAAQAWVRSHPHDPRTPAIRARIANQPTALWLTGNDSFGNLAVDATMARRGNRTMLLALWNIPMRWDGLRSPSTLSLAAYKTWISRVAKGLRGNRAVIVLEPDALWFYDRLPDAADRRIRLAALRYAVTTITTTDRSAHVYLDAGTASGSVTPTRMAALLVAADLRHATGYAVNVSSYAPTAQIQAYAHAIRVALQKRGVADPRYVLDTGRNGAPNWNDDWCNPSRQRLGVPPGVVRGPAGRDLDLWIKAPGTSDGNCGAPGFGQGTHGGEFLPSTAYEMITG